LEECYPGIYFSNVSFFAIFIRVCLILIMLACSRLRPSLSVVCVVKTGASRLFSQHIQHLCAASPHKYPAREGEDSENQTHSHLDFVQNGKSEHEHTRQSAFIDAHLSIFGQIAMSLWDTTTGEMAISEKVKLK